MMATWVRCSRVKVQIPRLASLARDDGRCHPVALRAGVSRGGPEGKAERSVAPARPSSRVAPDGVRDVGDELELGRLVVRAERVARFGGGKAALRAEGEPLERDELRRFIDTAYDLVLLFEPCF